MPRNSPKTRACAVLVQAMTKRQRYIEPACTFGTMLLRDYAGNAKLYQEALYVYRRHGGGYNGTYIALNYIHHQKGRGLVQGPLEPVENN